MYIGFQVMGEKVEVICAGRGMHNHVQCIVVWLRGELMVSIAEKTLPLSLTRAVYVT